MGNDNIYTLFDEKIPQDSRRKCESKGNIYTLFDERISQSNRQEIEREPQDNIVTFNDLDRVRYNRQLSEAEKKEKKGDIILNVARKDGRYFLHPYFNSSGSTVFINPEDPSKGFYEKNGKFCYGKTGGDTGNKLKEFKQEEIEELKIKRTMGEKDFYKRINETELDKYFGKFKKPGYTWGDVNINSITNNVDNQKEPMDSVRKKNNHINDYTSTLTHESTCTDSNQTYQHDINYYNNLENLGYSVINQNNTNFLDSSYEDYLGLNNCNNINLPNNNDSHEFNGFSLESYEKPSCTYLTDGSNDCSFSSKPDNYHNKQTDEWQQINNNVNYNTNLNYPYINDGEYNYF